MSTVVLKYAARGLLGLVIWFTFVSPLVAQETSRFIEPWGAVFAEQKVVFHLQTEGQATGWSL